MTSTALQIVRRILITATAVVLALVIGATFMRVLRPPDPDAIARNRIEASSSSPPGTIVDGGLPAVPPSTTPTEVAETTTTGPGPPEPSATCGEPAAPSRGGTVLQIYFTCGESVVPIADSFVYRAVPATELVLTATLAEMVKGPTEAEMEMGYSSLFSEATSNAIAGLSLSGGEATIDFAGLDEIEGISAPEAGLFFLADLNANVFQFGTISSVEYRLDGSCDAFWELFGEECHTVTRSDWREQLQQWRGR